MGSGSPSRPVPPRSAWGDYKSDVDLRNEYRVFAGKSIEETGYILIADPARLHHFVYAPDEVFYYYILAVADHLMRDESKGAADAANYFISVVRQRIEMRPQTFISDYSSIKRVLDVIADRQRFYGADENIYGSFPARRDEIDRLHSAHR